MRPTVEHTSVFVRLRKKYKSRSGMVFGRKEKKKEHKLDTLNQVLFLLLI
jgi:hypothetical protein